MKFQVKCDDVARVVEIWDNNLLVIGLDFNSFRKFYKTLTPAFKFVSSSITEEEYKKFEEAGLD